RLAKIEMGTLFFSFSVAHSFRRGYDSSQSRTMVRTAPATAATRWIRLTGQGASSTVKKSGPDGEAPMKCKRTQLVLEEWECRDLLSAGVLPTEPLLAVARDASLHAAQEAAAAWHHATDAVAGIMLTAIKNQPAARFSSLNPAWYTPAQIQQAYGFS